MEVIEPSTRPAVLVASDAVAIVAFVTVGLVSHDHDISATGYARDALPILGAWFGTAFIVGTYRSGGMQRLLTTWAVGVSLGVLIRGVVLGRSLNADQFEFLGVALVFSLLFVLALRGALAAVGAADGQALIYDALRGLPLTIDRVETETLSHVISPEFTRKTTVVHFVGGGAEGVGEDVTYDPREHEERFPQLDLAGEWTLESLAARLDEIDLFPAGEPDQHAYRDYRRWAFESAALDLALAARAGRSATRSAASTVRCGSPPRRGRRRSPTGSRSIPLSASSRTLSPSGRTSSWRSSPAAATSTSST